MYLLSPNIKILGFRFSRRRLATPKFGGGFCRICLGASKMASFNQQDGRCLHSKWNWPYKWLAGVITPYKWSLFIPPTHSW